MIIIDIEIKKRSKTKEFFHKLHDKLEDLMFSVIMKLPDGFIPHFLMEWLSNYTTRRIQKLQQEHIKQTWKNMYLQDAVNEISNRQRNTKKAPSDI